MRSKEKWDYLLEEWKYTFRGSIFLIGILGLIWFIWFLVAKRVPEFSQIRVEFLGEIDQTIDLTFSISRWWDLLIISLWPISYKLIYGSKFFKNLGVTDKNNFFANNWVWGIFIGGLFFNIWAGQGYLISLIIGFALLFGVSIWSEIASFYYRKAHILSFSIENTVYALLLNLSTGITIGLAMIFSIGLIPGLVIGLISFLTITLFQYTLIKFFRVIYYFVVVKTGIWLGIIKQDC